MFRSKPIKNGVCCYTWGEKRAIGNKKRTMLLHFGRSKPLNAAKNGACCYT